MAHFAGPKLLLLLLPVAPLVALVATSSLAEAADLRLVSTSYAAGEEGSIERSENISSAWTLRMVGGQRSRNLALCDAYYEGQHSPAEPLQESLRRSVLGRIVASAYSDLLQHHYTSRAELFQAAGPHTDQEACLRELEWLSNLARKLTEQRYSLADPLVGEFFDTWGRARSGSLAGATLWAGNYADCLRSRLVSSHYCLASRRHIDWPQENRLEKTLAIKQGVCLPRTCDSLNYKNKFELIRQIGEFALAELDRGQTFVSEVYCLPDEQSALRNIWQSPASAITLAAFGLWLTLVVLATLIERASRSHQSEHESQSNRLQASAADVTSRPAVGLSSGFKLRNSIQAHEDQSASGSGSRGLINELAGGLSLASNLKSLFSLAQRANSAGQATGQAESGQACAKQLEATRQTYRVDLATIDGIKVMCTCYIITGHVLMVSSVLFADVREMALANSPAFYAANLIPAFAVNSFFTITGLLTAYLLFRQNQAGRLWRTPGKWFLFALYRYLRLVPVYALVVLYNKHLARYTGSGPLWDYGTSALAQRRRCTHESWLWTFTLSANFMDPTEHCIPPGWYLANDFQFFLVTPALLGLLAWRARLARKLIALGVVLSFTANFLSLYLSDLADLTAIARFRPHGFKIYATYLSYNYTQPQYRILSYLIGLLIGHQLFDFERRFRSATVANVAAGTNNTARPIETTLENENGFNARKLSPLQTQTSNDHYCHLQEHSQQQQRQRQRQLDLLDLPNLLKQHGIFLSVFGIIGFCFTAYIGSMIPFSPSLARFMAALITPLYHLLFSLNVGLFITLAAAGGAQTRRSPLVRFLGLPHWRPLSRLSLCAVLVNIEVIAYLMQTSHQQINYSNMAHQLLNVTSLVLVYAVSLLLHLFFEAPIRFLIGRLLSVLLAGTRPKATSRPTSPITTETTNNTKATATNDKLEGMNEKDNNNNNNSCL